MRALVDMVDSVGSVIRFVVGILVLGMLAFGLIMTVGATYVAPQAADKFAERAERVGNKAIAAAQQEARNAALAEEGWGYETGNSDFAPDEDGASRGGDDWGDTN